VPARHSQVGAPYDLIAPRWAEARANGLIRQDILEFRPDRRFDGMVA